MNWKNKIKNKCKYNKINTMINNKKNKINETNEIKNKIK